MRRPAPPPRRQARNHNRPSSLPTLPLQQARFFATLRMTFRPVNGYIFGFLVCAASGWRSARYSDSLIPWSKSLAAANWRYQERIPRRPYSSPVTVGHVATGRGGWIVGKRLLEREAIDRGQESASLSALSGIDLPLASRARSWMTKSAQGWSIAAGAAPGCVYRR